AHTPELLAKDKKENSMALVFSPGGGVYATNVVLRLTTGSSSAIIRYTLNGTEPDESSPVYSGSVQLTASTLVRAKVFDKGSPAGPTRAESYTLLDADLMDFSSNLPLVIINSFGTNITHEWSVPAGVQFIDSAKGRARLTSAADLSRTCLIHVRGRASL